MLKYDASIDYYARLGVPETASADEIQRAFRTRARRQHPDSGGSEEGMKSLNEARAILTDGETRRAYDRERAGRRAAPAPAPPPQAEAGQGSLEIPITAGEFSGTAISAAGCLVIGLGMLLLVEGQWVFFLWPLRLLSAGLMAVGVFLAFAAINLYEDHVRQQQPRFQRTRFLLIKGAFWALVFGAAVLLIRLLYVA